MSSELNRCDVHIPHDRRNDTILTDNLWEADVQVGVDSIHTYILMESVGWNLVCL